MEGIKGSDLKKVIVRKRIDYVEMEYYYVVILHNKYGQTYPTNTIYEDIIRYNNLEDAIKHKDKLNELIKGLDDTHYNPDL